MLNYNLLVVDDEKNIRQVLVDLFKAQGYSIRQACNGIEALELIDELVPDLVISDIQMPGMDGFELFKVIESKYPRIKHVLMTSYDVDQYISHIRKHNIGNILTKGAEFNLVEISAYIKALLTGNIFGLERYFLGIHQKAVSLTRYSDARNVCDEIINQMPEKSRMYLQVAIDELISNAFFHGVLELTGIPRELWCDDYEIDPQSAITVTWAHDDEKVGVSIVDPKGNLKKNDVLKWLDTCREEKLGQEHGRGLLLVRRLIDRMIINIDPGKRTECIVIQYFEKSSKTANKPLLVHEL
jgi:CheY-like chemotaxis protein